MNKMEKTLPTTQNSSHLSKLKEYFERCDEVLIAFVFGSQAKNTSRFDSDWDIAVYFKPKKFLELETKIDYPFERKISFDVEKVLETEVDFLVLNRAKPSLVFSILNAGIPLVIKDKRLYLKLLSKTHYEAVDFWNFVLDFWKIRERSKSLSIEDKAILIEHLVFLEEEFKDIEKFKKMNWEEYSKSRDDRRNIERWVENLVMSALDIAKIILSSEKKEIPQTYRETLKIFGVFYINPSFAKRFSEFAELRNIVVHEYLDMRWERIKKFIKEAEKLYPQFIKRIKVSIYPGEA